MIPLGNRVTVSGRKARPSTATSSNNQLAQINTPPVNRLTNNDITKQLLQIKESDVFLPFCKANMMKLELAKARFDFQIELEKQRTFDYQNMLKDNYEGAAKMFQKINNEQIELIKKENENVIQKLLKRHNDEILTLTSKHEQEMKVSAEEKKKMCETYEERIKTMKKEFSDTFDKQQRNHEEKLENLKEEMKNKYDKKFEAYKKKLKAKCDSLKEKSEKKADEKLEEMFEKMNKEFEKRQNDLYNTLVEKDGVIRSLERKLAQYQLEIDKWKDLHYATQKNQTSENISIRNTNQDQLEIKGIINQSVQLEKQREIESGQEVEDKQPESFEEKERKISQNSQREYLNKNEQGIEEKTSSLETNIKSAQRETNLLEKTNKTPEISKKGLDQQPNSKRIIQEVPKNQRGSSSNLQITIEKQREDLSQNFAEKVRKTTFRDTETMTDYFEEDKLILEKRINSEAELDQHIEKAEEKVQGIVDRNVELIRFYQTSLVKCLGKIKEYQILIQKFNVNS